MRSITRYVIPVIIVLAAIGVGSSLLNDPAGFFKSILMGIGFIALMLLAFRLIMAKRYGTSLFPSRSGPTRAQLSKAKRTSMKKVSPSSKKVKAISHKSAKRVSGPNLTVIEGKKSKKKNRAFF